MDKCAETQRKIFGIIEGIKKDIPRRGKEWNKFYGDIVCRIFIEFISKEIAPKYKIVGPNAYIRGFPIEFDILIVDKDAEHDKFVNAFEPEKVRCGVESKAHGIFGGRSELKKDVERIKQNFVRVNKEYPHIVFFYLTYEEVANAKRESSINYLRETTNLLDPYRVFCLKDSRSGNPMLGEWDKMVSFLKKSFYGQNVA